MELRPFAAAGLVLASVAPALAANEFCIAQDMKTKKCTILDKKPTDTSMIVVSRSGTIYKTRAEGGDRHGDGQGLFIQVMDNRPEASTFAPPGRPPPCWIAV
ncbi:hypothetical protein [Bradyrhizobium sp. WSM471]|uniref:hypothetical protein n=1 Tax=Bradyrhizobium sp. WSM471 TaxID=319017 RepID=UPI00024D19A8|nr:hypothetical protein Bra471DRAFT_00856 [Bradyrhizobium sp. WSM471]